MSDFVNRYRDARADPELVVLEGFHAIKHALRFGAEPLALHAADVPAALILAEDLAPDQRPRLEALLEEIPPAELERASPRTHPTGMIAIARRPGYELAEALARPGPAVMLEAPRRAGNLGACVRVAAAAGAAAVISTGKVDPWGVEAVRGAAGLQFALPVLWEPAPPPTSRALVAIDPDGDDLWSTELPAGAMLAFGGERSGLGEELLRRASIRVRIPMRAGVSSLNLATSVAAVLFGAYDRDA